MFKSGNVLSSNGRGIVREVRVAVFAVISRHIRRRDSLLFSLSLSFFFFFFFFVLLYYSYTYQLFSFLGLIFAIFSPFLAIDPPSKTLFVFFFRIFRARGSIFHIYSVGRRYSSLLLGGREREERTSESTRREE